MEPQHPARPDIHPIAIAAVGAAVLVLILLLSLLGHEQQAQGQQPSINTGSSETGLVHKADFGWWHYEANREQDGGRIHTAIYYDNSSIKALETYVAANKTQAANLAQHGGLIDVEITFRTLVDISTCQKWVKDQDLHVSLAATRKIAGKDRIGGSVDLEDPQISPLHDPGKVYAVRGTVDAARLPQLINDPLIFLLDVTPTLAKQDLVTAGVAATDLGNITVGSPFWEMEDFGIVVYPTPLPPPLSTPLLPAPLPTTVHQ